MTLTLALTYAAAGMTTAVDRAARAIAEPRRRAILRLVWPRERAAGEIAAKFDVTRPAISQHLSVLRDAGLVTERRVGARRLYRARPDGLRGLRAYLAGFWDDRLARLAAAAEAESRSTALRRRRRSR